MRSIHHGGAEGTEDLFLKDEKGRPRSVGYPEEWLRNVIRLRGDHFKLPVWEK